MMKHVIFCGVGSVCCCAGLAMGVGETPTTLEPSVGPVQRVAHIYYNLASGERVVTLLGDGQTSGADAALGSRSVWATQVQNPCAASGFTTEYFFGFDNPGESTVGHPSLSTNITILDYGDVETDTVVDCMQINWVTAHADTDADSDGVGDGVEGLAGVWNIWDVDNGRAINQCSRFPLIQIILHDLPGDLQDDGMLSAYTMDLDLRSDIDGLDLSFEIGDSDGDCQTAAFCNSSVFDSATGMFVPVAQADNDFDSMPDADLDGDGLFDWTWTVRFFQPGTVDFDNDGMVDGVPAPTTADTIGISFGFPEGQAIDNGGDEPWTWAIDTSVYDAGTGEEDRFAIYGAPDINGDIIYAGGFWFGGFACEPNPDRDGGYTPPAMFQFQLFGPRRGDCYADLNFDGTLDFFDVSAFLVAFQNGGDYNGDGLTDFFDVSAFLMDFNAGCP